METVHPICCGLDVHQAQVTACLRRVGPNGDVSLETREFSTVMRGLTELSDWLAVAGCPIAAMESTGVYWKPVWNVLSATMEVYVANAREVKQRRGKKTDKADAQWLAELLAHDLIQPSFVPPPQIGAFRDLLRNRTAMVQSRTQIRNRVLATLEATNIKLSGVASDPFGKSGRAMLSALVAGVRDPEELAQMAKGVLRRKIPELREAMAGEFTEFHALVIGSNLAVHDELERQIAVLDKEIERLGSSMQAFVTRLESIPGVGETAARIILSEIGTDMSRFVSAARLASWAGMCPGNHESAGKRKSGKTRKGNRYLRRVLTECAWAAKNTDTFLGRTFFRLQRRIGGKKAAMAIGHKILVIVYHLLSEETVYEDGRYDRPREDEVQRVKARAVAQLELLGYTVDLTERTAQPDLALAT